MLLKRSRPLKNCTVRHMLQPVRLTYCLLPDLRSDTDGSCVKKQISVSALLDVIPPNIGSHTTYVPALRSISTQRTNDLIQPWRPHRPSHMHQPMLLLLPLPQLTKPPRKSKPASAANAATPSSNPTAPRVWSRLPKSLVARLCPVRYMHA